MANLMTENETPIITGERTYWMTKAQEDDGSYSFYIIVDIDKDTLRETYLEFTPELIIVDEEEDTGESIKLVKLNWWKFQNSDISIQQLIPIFESLPQKTELELFAAFAKKLTGGAL